MTAPEPKDLTVTVEQFRAAVEHSLPHATVGGGVSEDGAVDEYLGARSVRIDERTYIDAADIADLS